ncbi:MAG: prepilin peptidase [Candidatus Micrarchaeota archaeon]
MNIESIIFGQGQMPQEMLRIVVAFIGLLAVSWYDLFNKRNVPNSVLYAFFAIAVIINLLFPGNLLEFSLIVTLFVGGISYIFYRTGQIGGADAIVMTALTQLLPIHPSFAALKFNFPFILSIFLFSGIAFVIYFLVYFMYRVFKEKPEPKPLYLLILIPYLLFSYIYISSPLFFPFYFLIISLSFLSIIFFYTYKESITRMLSEELPLKDVQEEEILALDLMDQKMVKKYNLQRLVTSNELNKMKKLKIKSVFVYTKLPPFLPFMLLGLILSLLFAHYLILS